LYSCIPQKSREENIAYIKNALWGKVVFRYYKKYGEMPPYFSKAHDFSGYQLPNRGDVNGDNLATGRLSKDSFYFHSFGLNGQNEMGKGDDLFMIYRKDSWVKNPIYTIRDQTNINP
jgi:hypothetical protein